jgi:integrase
MVMKKTGNNEHEELLKKIKSINKEFKSDCICVQLYVRTKYLCIRYSADGVRKDISPPGVNISLSGILKGKSIAQRIDAAIKDSVYSQEWLDNDVYRKKDKVKKITVGDLITKFPELWLKRRGGNVESTERQKKHTLNGYRIRFTSAIEKANCKESDLFDATFITKIIALYAEGTDKRFRLREALSVACTVFGISYDFTGIGKRPKPARRDLPTDKQIIEVYQSFAKIYDNPMAVKSSISGYQWLYAVIATYGLRPQEAFAIDLDKSFKPANKYWIYLDSKLTQGLKTGDRWVAPLRSEWVNLFNLTTPIYPTFTTEDVCYKVNKIGRYFLTHKIRYTSQHDESQHINITCYDLRHAYAIRCRKLGVDLLDSSQLMGHDPSTHSKHYQRWIGLDDRIASLEAAIERNEVANRQEKVSSELLTYTQIHDLKSTDKAFHHN